jgi:alpha,alpha-trehalose phosphorylase
MHLCGDAFTPEQKARNFSYYERLTVRDSSLSDGTEAVIAAEIGHLNLAYEYLVESALLDLHDLEHNTRDGVHIAALAGAWIALVEGFGGLRTHGENLCFSPRLPHHLERLAFKLRYRGRILQVTALQSSAIYALLDGSAIRLSHHAEPFILTPSEPVTRAIHPAPRGPRPKQPPGREPFHRHARD